MVDWKSKPAHLCKNIGLDFSIHHFWSHWITTILNGLLLYGLILPPGNNISNILLHKNILILELPNMYMNIEYTWYVHDYHVVFGSLG